MDPNEYTFEAPAVRLQRIGEIATFEVMQEDLDRLDALYATENTLLGFLSLCVGIEVSALLGFVGASDLKPLPTAIYVGVMVATGLGVSVTLVFWLRARKERPKFIEKIRARGRAVRAVAN